MNLSRSLYNSQNRQLSQAQRDAAKAEHDRLLDLSVRTFKCPQCYLENMILIPSMRARFNDFFRPMYETLEDAHTQGYYSYYPPNVRFGPP